MCIIIAKKKNVENNITEEILINSFEYNSDGAGFMYVEDGQVVIDKGYMTLSDFLRRYKDLCNKFDNFKNKSLVIHCRIGTSSGNTPENTHPYPVCGKEKHLHRLDFKCELGMAHNGIISSYTPTWKNPTTNDTQEFILKYVNVLYRNFKDFYKHNSILSGMEDITKSKLVFLDTEDDLYFVGDFISDKGIMYSNGTYKSYAYDYSYGTNHYHSWKDWRTYDYDDELLLKEEDDILKTRDINEEDLVYLENDWYIATNFYNEEVGDRFLAYDYTRGDLYEVMDDGTIELLDTNVVVYDANFEEVF